MKKYVFPPDSLFLKTYGTTASTVFDPLYLALSQRDDWEKASFSEPTIELPAGKYAFCEEGSGRILSFLVKGRASTPDSSVKLGAGESLRLISQTGMPPFYLRITQDALLEQTDVHRIWVEFLPIEAHDFQDGGRLQVIRTQAFDYCADERLSKVASTILDSRNITNKTNLVQTLSSFVGEDGFIPQTYQIQFGGWYGRVPDPKESQVWFLKNSAMDRASGIELLSNPLEALQKVDRKHRYVLQPALKKPRLLDGKKYDMRFYVVVAHDNIRRWLGIYHKGLTRKCPLPFQADSLNPGAQLSNHIPDGVESQPFNEAKYAVFDPASPDYEAIWSAVKVIVSRVGEATRYHLAARRKGCRFHLLSLDFAVDQDQRVWLFEANNSPGLTIDHSQIQDELIAPMINGLVDVAIKPLLENRIPRAIEDWFLITD